MKWQQRRDIIITGSSIHGLVKLFICLAKATRAVGSQTSTDNYLTENSSHLIPRQVWDVRRGGETVCYCGPPLGGGQGFETHREWSCRQVETYHTSFQCVHIAGLETPRDLWHELKESRRRISQVSQYVRSSLVHW
ncbi:hypothetical protein N7524_001355 [Penicillium chrysogenum]|nr:hypothetical protein N7524_001355 [Penicillium chrysogenum]